MQTVLDNTSYGGKYNYNIKDRIPKWAELNHYPVVNVKRDYNTNNLNISVENFNTNISIPVIITTLTYSWEGKTSPAIWLVPPQFSEHILIEDSTQRNDWVLVDLRKSGKY